MRPSTRSIAGATLCFLLLCGCGKKEVDQAGCDDSGSPGDLAEELDAREEDIRWGDPASDLRLGVSLVENLGEGVHRCSLHFQNVSGKPTAIDYAGAFIESRRCRLDGTPAPWAQTRAVLSDWGGPEERIALEPQSITIREHVHAPLREVYQQEDDGTLKLIWQAPPDPGARFRGLQVRYDPNRVQGAAGPVLVSGILEVPLVEEGREDLPNPRVQPDAASRADGRDD